MTDAPPPSEALPPFEGVTPQEDEANRKAGIAGHVIIDGKRRQAKNIDSLRKMVRAARKDEP